MDIVDFAIVALAATNWALGLRIVWVSLPFRATFLSPYHVYVITVAWLIVTADVAVTAGRSEVSSPLPSVAAFALAAIALAELYRKMLARQKTRREVKQ